MLQAFIPSEHQNHCSLQVRHLGGAMTVFFLEIWNWGGIDKYLGCVNMREAQTYIKIQKKQKNYTKSAGGGGVSQLRGSFDSSPPPPSRGV